MLLPTATCGYIALLQLAELRDDRQLALEKSFRNQAAMLEKHVTRLQLNDESRIILHAS